MIRVYQTGTFKQDIEIALASKASHHLKHVLRVKIGDDLLVFNETSGEWRAQVHQLSKQQVVIKVVAQHRLHSRTALPLTLVQGVVRSDKMDIIVQKTSELGISRLIPIITERSNVRSVSDQRIERWQEVSINASEQCGRIDILKIERPLIYRDWLTHSEPPQPTFILDPYSSATTQFEILQSLTQPPNEVALMVGPEGGFTPTEIEEAKACACQSLYLGPRILRAETAAIVGAGLLQWIVGDLKGPKSA